MTRCPSSHHSDTQVPALKALRACHDLIKDTCLEICHDQHIHTYTPPHTSVLDMQMSSGETAEPRCLY